MSKSNDLINFVKDDNIGDFQKRVTKSGDAAGTNFNLGETKGYVALNNLSLLHIAAHYNSIECFIYMIETMKMQFDIASAESYTPLHYACLGGATEVASYILKEHPKEGAKETNTTYQYLFLAVVSGNSDIITLLFNSGCDPNSKKNRDNFPIKKAIELHYIDCIKLLLRHSAKNEGYNQDTALMFAIRRGEFEAVPLLLDAGEDASLYINTNGKRECALQLACQQQSTASILAICQRLGDRINPSEKEGRQESYPVHWICMSSKPDIVRIVLQYNIDVNATDNNGKGGPSYLIGRMHGTRTDDKIEILNLLYEKGLDVNFTNDLRKKPFLAEFLDSLSCDPELVKWFLEHGADLNKPEKQGSSTTLLTKLSKSQKLRTQFEPYIKAFQDANLQNPTAPPPNIPKSKRK